MRPAFFLVALALLAPANVHAAKPEQAFPLGDGYVKTSSPHAGRALACGPLASGAPPAAGPWVKGASWTPAERPVIPGSVVWPPASFVLDGEGSKTSFAGNGLPLATATGTFPDGEKPALAAHDVSGAFAEAPAARRTPGCIDPAAPVAISTNGVPVFAPFDASGFDLLARETVDRCGGRTDAAGLYRYRGASPCLGRRSSRTAHSGLVGWARDGFGLYGPRGAGGVPLRSDDLDTCHGHTHRISIGGVKREAYHYHATPDFPYAIGCFRGRPSGGWRITRPPAPTQEEPATETPQEPPQEPPPPPPPSLDEASIDTDPAPFPAFDRGVSDYVVRCEGDPVEVTTSSPDGLTVAIDGAPGRSGPQSVAVPLEAGEGFDVVVANRDASRTLHVRCLPPDFPPFTVERDGTPQAQWYMIAPSFSFTAGSAHYVAIFDSHGVPVWWFRDDLIPSDFKLLPNGHPAWHATSAVAAFEQDPAAHYTERTLAGEVVRTFAAVGVPTDNHDLQLLPNGNALFVTYKRRDHVDLSSRGGPSDATVLDGEVQEVDPDGDLVWSWNTKDHISLREGDRWGLQPNTLTDGTTAYDIIHMNAVEPDGDGVIVSLRHTDAVYRVDRATGDIEWKLGGTPTSQSLDVVGDPHEGNMFGGQHDVRRYSDGTVTLYDNGTVRSRGPRLVRYAIDETARTATLVEEITDPEVTNSFCCGGTRKLPGGNWVAAWSPEAFVSEHDPEGNRVMVIRIAPWFTYRVVGLEPGRLSAAALRQGMDAMAAAP